MIGGRWEVSQVALQMFLDTDLHALKLYLCGDRDNLQVVSYFTHLGIKPQKAIAA
jgi:hypothetical protein